MTRALGASSLLVTGLVMGCGGPSLSIETSALPPGRVGQPYEARLEASGPEGIVWSLPKGRLPAGLAFSRTGRIAGTPEESGRFELTIAAALDGASSESSTLILDVDEGPALTLHTTRLPEAVAGLDYGARLEASGGVPPYRFSVTAGALPEGLALAVDAGRARLAGTPRKPGLYPFGLEVRDDRGGSITRQITLRVAKQRTPIRVATERLPAGRRGEPYRAEVLSGGGAGEAIAWDLTGGRLPPGLSLEPFGTPATTLTGTPTRTGRYTFEVAAFEPSGAVATQTLTVEIGSNPIRVDEVELPVAEVGRAYTATLTLAGGSGRALRTAVAEGRLPRGLSLSRTEIAGTPLEAGRFPLVIAVEDEAGTATVALSLEVLDGLRLGFVQLPDAEVGRAYTASVTAAGVAGQDPKFEVGELAPGLSARAEASILRVVGQPTAGGLYTTPVSVTDARGRTTRSALTLRVHPRLAIVTSTLPAAVSGEPYEASLQTRGGRPGPRLWKVASGRLPEGLALDARAGRLVGRATATGRHPLTVRVEGAGTATRAFVLEVR